MMNMPSTAMNIHLNPLLPADWLIVIAVMASGLLILSMLKSRRHLFWRSATLATFMLALLNPSLLQEEREPLNDVAVVVVDRSGSQMIGERQNKTNDMLAHLEEEAKRFPNLDLRVIETPDATSTQLHEDTRLFAAIERAFADVPSQRRAGLVLLTDGQIHDIPQNPDSLNYGPVHALLSGNQNEKDRRIVITQAPAYGIVGQNITVTFKVEDTDNIRQDNAQVTIKQPGEHTYSIVIPANQEQNITIPIGHAGQNVVELSTETLAGEITSANNTTPLLINGVRDRLKVLLVTGKPHPGARSWRDLLTSDPGVDLVHFTILRDPNKLDATPQNELSLIAFPFRELFEVKLYDFDLIIFDQYRLNRILPEAYFRNIVNYVERGGALLEASGPSFASENSVYFTALMHVLPGAPTGDVIEKPFKPLVTAQGHHHPVTKGLFSNADLQNPDWGQWLRQISINVQSGDTLMSGIDEQPLLVLDRILEGRVAQIASDHIWLWSRGYEGGGPHAELLRRVVHWLMKEPALDERALTIEANEQEITLSRQNFQQQDMDVRMTKPDGTKETITLSVDENGIQTTKIQADQLGIYSFTDSNNQSRFVIIGTLNPPEQRDILSTKDKVEPLTKASKGSVRYISQAPKTGLRLMSDAQNYNGRNWIGLRQNNHYNVQTVQQQPLFPPELAAFLILGLVIVSWWREGRTS